MDQEGHGPEPAKLGIVRIHVDREAYEAPNPTTGEKLYILAGIPENRELFREVSGEVEDAPVVRSDSEIVLRQDEHFYSQRDYDIMVNARKRIVTSRVLSFQNVIRLAFEQLPTGPNILFTVVYRKGPDRNPAGTLVEGQSVIIRDGMVFNVTTTDKS